MSIEEVKHQLMREDPFFRSLHEKHAHYDRELKELSTVRAMSTSDQKREVELKKLKLHIKDEMEKRVHEFGSRPMAQARM